MLSYPILCTLRGSITVQINTQLQAIASSFSWSENEAVKYVPINLLLLYRKRYFGMIQYLGFWAMSDIGLVVVHVLVKSSSTWWPY